VATQWLDTAGQSPMGIFDSDCLTLARLHSDAVDFQKSGQPVDTNKIPKRRNWPAPQTLCAIDRLSIAINLPDVRPRRTDATRLPLSEDEAEVDVLLSLDDDEGDPLHLAVQSRVRQFLPPALIHMGETSHLFKRYSIALLDICTTHTLTHSKNALLAEEEAIIGTIVAKTSQSRARTQVIAKLRDQTDLLVRGIREELAGERLEEESTAEEMLARAWACWKFSVAHKERFGGKSFGWIALGAIFEAIKAIEEE
jgi:RNA-dependent RNA polymerase